MRLLLEDDEFLEVAEALNTFMAGSSDPRRATAGRASDSVDVPSSTARLASTSQAQQSTVVENRVGGEVRANEVASDAIDTSQYKLVAKLGANEARLLAAVLDMNVGDLVKDKKRNPQFAAARLRRPIVEAAFYTKIEAELIRYKSSGRRTNIGFSLEEIQKMSEGMTTAKEVLPVFDSMLNTVGAIRFHRIKGVQFGAVEFYRIRQSPGNRRRK